MGMRQRIEIRVPPWDALSSMSRTVALNSGVEIHCELPIMLLQGIWHRYCVTWGDTDEGYTAPAEA